VQPQRFFAVALPIYLLLLTNCCTSIYLLFLTNIISYNPFFVTETAGLLLGAGKHGALFKHPANFYTYHDTIMVSTKFRAKQATGPGEHSSSSN
jgi:hypothetical protein